MIRLEMKHYNIILTKKVKNNIKIELLLLKALSSGKIDKYKYLLSEKTFLSNRSQIIEQAKFTFLQVEVKSK